MMDQTEMSLYRLLRKIALRVFYEHEGSGLTMTWIAEYLKLDGDEMDNVLAGYYLASPENFPAELTRWKKHLEDASHV